MLSSLQWNSFRSYTNRVERFKRNKESPNFQDSFIWENGNNSRKGGIFLKLREAFATFPQKLQICTIFHQGGQQFQKQSSRGVLCSVQRVLRNFTKFTRKHLFQSLFFNKVAGQACNFIKTDYGTSISPWILWDF